MQSFLVALIVLAALGFLVRRALRKKKCGGGECHCGGIGKGKQTPLP